ncbi:MAG: glycosyltransferase family 2 protein [Paludibacter sp.]|nr:glycosyltransferase family 2 protein [Paludibacter sp.]
MNSICITTYNGEKYIMEQLNSILSQINVDDEVIISDDGSTDKTIELIMSFNDSRIKIINANFHNVIRNFENTLKHAKGEYVFLSDQDDVWLPTKYEKCISLLKKYDLVVTDAIVTDSNLNVLYSSFAKHFGSGKGVLKNICRSSYFGAFMAFRKKTLDYALPFPNDKEIGHDLWIGLVAELTGKVYFYNEPLIKYRRHEKAFTNISTKLNRSNRKLITKIYGRIIMFVNVTKFYINYKFNLCKKN